MANAWVEHVRSKATEMGISYGCALSMKEVKDSYVKTEKKKTGKKQVPEVVIPEKKRKKILPKNEIKDANVLVSLSQEAPKESSKKPRTFQLALQELMMKNKTASERAIMETYLEVVEKEFPWEKRTNQMEQMVQVISKKFRESDTKENRSKDVDLRDAVFDLIDEFKMKKRVDNAIKEFAMNYLEESGLIPA
jgi:predicted kinase